ncbi:MAG: hypothetical protein IPI91_01655 [Flavobacteriales bacterium]|nr:hypothetical protein [Flavobacteriales bacterium]
MKGEQRKGSPLLTAHVSIQSTNGYIGPDSDSEVYAAAVAFVQRHSTAIRRQLAQQELSASEKTLIGCRTTWSYWNGKRNERQQVLSRAMSAQLKLLRNDHDTSRNG